MVFLPAVKSSDTVIFTVAIGERYRQQAELCRASFQGTHPDVPFLLFNEEDYKLFAGQSKPGWVGEVVALRAVVGWFLSFCFERVIYVDSDVVALAHATEFLECEGDAVLTADVSTFHMGVPDLPIVNCGMAAGRGRKFWREWTRINHEHLLPAVKIPYFDQLSLRVLAGRSKLNVTILDEPGLKRFYNVCLQEQTGEWRVDRKRIFKGENQVVFYHQAGQSEASILTLPPVIHDWLALRVKEVSADVPHVDFKDLWNEQGAAFLRELRDCLTKGPVTLSRELPAKCYAATPDLFLSSTPAAFDKFRPLRGVPFKRHYQADPPLFYYSATPPPPEPPRQDRGRQT